MRDRLKDGVAQLYGPLGQGHNRLREEMMATLPDAVPKQRPVYWRRKQPRMTWLKAIVSTPKRKIAFTCCIALVLAAAAWAGQKVIIKLFIFKEEGPIKKVTSPEGKTTYHTSGRAAAIASDDPDFNEEKARKQFEEIKKAIASGNAQLVETEREGVYIFKVVLSDGTIVGGEYAGRVPPEHKPKSPNQ